MEDLKDSLKFKTWSKALKDNQVTLNGFKEKAIIRKHNGEVLFAFLEIDAIDESNRPLPRAVLLRGHFVSIVTCLINKDSKEKYFLLVKQRRVGTGGYFYEHPAGMCDNEADPLYVAVKEVKEETGLEITEKQLFPLWKDPLYSSAGLLDEAGYYFGCKVEMDASELKQFQNKITGAENENEFIETYLCPEKEIFGLLKNSNGLLATLLFLRNQEEK